SGAHANLGAALLQCGRTKEALPHYRRAVQLRPRDTVLAAKLSTVLTWCGHTQEAEERLGAILSREPAHAGAAANLADLLEHRGDFVKAAEVLRPALDQGTMDPNLACVHAVLMRRMGRPEQAVPHLRRVLAGSNSREQEVVLQHALAFQLDATGEVDEAFAAALRANQLRSARFDHGVWERYQQALLAVYAQDRWPRIPRSSQDEPGLVFVVGMPRSGSSLCEQILASHPEIHGAGERTDVLELVGGLQARLGAPEPYPLCVPRLDGEALGVLADEHRSLLMALGDGARYVTDKLPHNFLHLGLLAQLHPGAQVIHCIRDPLDTCLSCFFQNFDAKNPYATSLEDLGVYWRGYQRLMAHWKQVLPLPIHEVRYETLVAEPEVETRRLLSFLGLPWEPSCLSFHESSRRVHTASYDQVRQPIYQSSVGRSDRYHHHLGPLIDALGLGTEDEKSGSSRDGANRTRELQNGARSSDERDRRTTCRVAMTPLPPPPK
ncbi:MAG: sulfotransferase, partial [Myxococcota bacterium]|nr:sulfotransferase [Myxococcota bacterium]